MSNSLGVIFAPNTKITCKVKFVSITSTQIASRQLENPLSENEFSIEGEMEI
jgi:hypothetical protein